MKTEKRKKRAVLPVGILGLIGLALRIALYRVAVDDRGLLVYRHPLEIGLIFVTLAALIGILRAVFQQKKDAQAVLSDPQTVFGDGVMTLGVACSLVWMRGIFRLIGLLTLLFQGMAAISEGRKKAVPYLCRFALCVFFAAVMVGSYRGWSGDPQPQNHVFSLLALVCLMLFAYQSVAFSVGLGSGESELFFGLAAWFCCIVALAHTETPILYLTSGIWAATRLPKDAAPAREQEG